MLNKQKKRSRSPRPAFVIVLLVIIIPTSGWWLWRGLYPPAPRLNSILLSINHEPRRILPGETVLLHSSDKVSILEISTNIFLNLNVRLASEGFDVNALRHEDISLSSLLPGQNIFDHYTFRVLIKYRNNDLGHNDWDIQTYAEDWLEKANRTINKKQRIALLENGLRVLPEDSRIWRRLLDEYKSQKLWKRAASMLEKTAEQDPNQEILSELLEIYAAMSSKKKVISILNKLLELDPKDLNLRLQLAEILEESKKYKPAIKEYEELVKRVDKNEKLSIYKRLGYLYTKTWHYHKAIQHYLKAAKLDKKDANLFYNLSYLYDKIKEKEKSHSYLEKAAGLNTKDVESRLVLAQRLIKTGDLKKAGKYISEVLKKEPSSLEALLLKARIAEKQGKKKELKKIYKKVHSLDPKNETVLYNLGALNYESGDLKSSLAYFKKYIKKKPKDTAAHEIVFDIYKKQKNEKMAFEKAQLIVKLNPKKVEPYHFIFSYLNKRKEYKKIIPILEQGVKSNPKQTDLREKLLFAYLKTGKEDLAVKQMDELLKIRPNDVVLLLQMARLLEKQENFTRALKTYKKVISKSPDNEEAEAAYLRLRLKGVRTDQ